MKDLMMRIRFQLPSLPRAERTLKLHLSAEGI